MRSKPPAPTKPSPAFTVLELLIVIAIVAVLAALGLAVFGKVKNSSRYVVDASNLKTIGLAVLNYAADNQGKIPSQTVGVHGARITTASYNLSGGAAPRRLYSGVKWGLSGAGTQDYVFTPSLFYSPSVPEFKNRPADQFYRAPNGSFYIGYSYYYMPRVDETGRSPIVEGVYNDRVTEGARAPIYSNIIFPLAERERFTSERVFVVYLDGRVQSFNYGELTRLSLKECVKRMAGM